MGIHNRIQAFLHGLSLVLVLELAYTLPVLAQLATSHPAWGSNVTSQHGTTSSSARAALSQTQHPANVQKNIGICDHINYYYLALNNISRRSRMVRGRERFGSCWNIIIKVLVRWTQGLHNVCSMVVHCPEETQHIFGDQMPPIEFVCGSICAYAQSIFAFFELIRLFG